MRSNIFLVSILFFTACTTTTPVPVPTPAPVIVEPLPPPPPAPSAPVIPPESHSQLYKACASGTWCYDELVAGRVTNRLVKTDPGVYCPRYPELKNKVPFWVAFAKSVTRAETGWKPASTYTEKFIDSYTGKRAVSAGMFQLSIGDKVIYKAYPSCAELSELSLLDPIENLKCGMSIFDKLAGSRPSWKESAGRYWSTIRDNRNPTDGISLVATVKKYYPECF